MFNNTTIFKHFQSRDHKMTSLSIRSIVKWCQVQSEVHVTARLIWPELTHSTTYTCFKFKVGNSTQTRHFYFSSKYVGWLYVPSQGHITTCRKPLNLLLAQHLRLLNPYNCICFIYSKFSKNLNFSPEV